VLDRGRPVHGVGQHVLVRAAGGRSGAARRVGPGVRVAYISAPEGDKMLRHGSRSTR
jgi:hypothetical protein